MQEHIRIRNRTVLLLVLATILLGAAVAFELFMITWPISAAHTFGQVALSSPTLNPNVSSNASCSVPSGATAAIADGAAQAPRTTPTPSTAWGEAQALVARLQKQLISHEGQMQDYGVPLNDAGYQTLLQWNNDLRVEASYADAFESLDMRLPCCDWTKPSRDEKTNCGCGHHQALEGLSKKLLSEGWTHEAVQREVTRWSDYFFPEK